MDHIRQADMENSYEEPQVTRTSSSEFKTSLFGFDREDVLSYIDRLVGDISDQKSNLEQTMERLTGQNRDLVERVNRYEQQMQALQKDLEDEHVYSQNAHEREDLFKKAISVLQEKVAFLQNNTVTPTGGTDADFESQTQRANEIVLRLREELLRKDENIGRLTEELSRRNEILLSQDKLLSARNTQLEEQLKGIEQQKRELLRRANEINRLTEQIASLQSRVRYLEEKRTEISGALNETRARMQQVLQQQARDREALDRARLEQYERQRREEVRRAEELRRATEESLKSAYQEPVPPQAAGLGYPPYAAGYSSYPAPPVPPAPRQEEKRHGEQQDHHYQPPQNAQQPAIFQPEPYADPAPRQEEKRHGEQQDHFYQPPQNAKQPVSFSPEPYAEYGQYPRYDGYGQGSDPIRQPAQPRRQAPLEPTVYQNQAHPERESFYQGQQQQESLQRYPDMYLSPSYPNRYEHEVDRAGQGIRGLQDDSLRYPPVSSSAAY